MNQEIITTACCSEEIRRIMIELCVKKYLLVCDSSFCFLPLKDELGSIAFPYAVFQGFTSNPLYEDVANGVSTFRRENCDAILAVGGGSALDVAKCIKLFCRMEDSGNYLQQEFQDSDVPLIAVPTTAGTGSESTRFAVIYYEGKKQSVTHESILPNYAILDADLLQTLPVYQKKCTVLDALSQAIESWWSLHSTDESKDYSKSAIHRIVHHMDQYLDGGNGEANAQILLAANEAGRAINITQTTAPHAMSYRLTSLYHLPHGHAVSICLPKVWRYMLAHMERCADARGADYLARIFQNIAQALGCNGPSAAVAWFEMLLERLGIESPQAEGAQEVQALAESVNLTRLKNNPVHLDTEALLELYGKIVGIEGKHEA
jgi:alcohol dehydrogenase class IV